MNKIILTTACLGSLLAMNSLSAQVVYNTVGGNYLEDFSGMVFNSSAPATSGSINASGVATGLPEWRITSGTSAPTQYVSAWSGAGDAGGFLSNGTAGDAVKSLQIMTSTSPDTWDGNTRFGNRTGSTLASVFATVEFINNTGGTLTEFDVSYQAAQFFARDGGALDVRYSFDNLNFTTIDGSGGLGGSTNMRYTAPVVSNGVNLPLDLTQINNSITDLSSTVTGLTWDNGDSLYLQFAFWRVVPGASSTSSPVLSIDNVQFAAVPEPSAATLILIGLCGFVFVLRRRRTIDAT